MRKEALNGIYLLRLKNLTSYSFASGHWIFRVNITQTTAVSKKVTMGGKSLFKKVKNGEHERMSSAQHNVESKL